MYQNRRKSIQWLLTSWVLFTRYQNVRKIYLVDLSTLNIFSHVPKCDDDLLGFSTFSTFMSMKKGQNIFNSFYLYQNMMKIDWVGLSNFSTFYRYQKTKTRLDLHLVSWWMSLNSWSLFRLQASQRWKINKDRLYAFQVCRKFSPPSTMSSYHNTLFKSLNGFIFLQRWKQKIF